MTIVFLGSGNVATHLAKSFFEVKVHQILQVFSPTLANAKTLADGVGAKYTDDPKEIFVEADLYMIALKDDAVGQIVAQMPKKLKGLIVHTSGTNDVMVLDKFDNFGVFYPLQTFKKNLEMAMENIPFLVEANSTINTQKLIDLAQAISPKVFVLDSNQRLNVHIAAVFACNFVNYLLTISHELLTKNGLELTIIEPLIQKTIENALTFKPENTQTGPAFRGDKTVVEKHFLALANDPQTTDFAQIYRLISQQIADRYASKC